MKLANKLKKTMGLMLISTMVLSAAPVMAADYDNHWAKEAITKWSDYEVVAGYEDGVFKPNNEVKRAELAAFVTRVFGLESTKGATSFTDVAASAWYGDAVAKVSAAGIMQGASGKFNPNGYATREEVAVTLVNAFQLTGSGNVTFKDQDQIGAWAKDAVSALASNGYAKGQADGKFAPKANITRAEVVQLLDNIVKELVHKPGTYTSSVAGNVVINTKDAVLDGITVSGNIYLAQGIGLGDATLKNIEVAGQVFVSGGGVNSIHFDKAVVKGGVIVDTKAPIRLVSNNSNLQVTAKAGQNLVLTGSFKEVIVPADAVVELKGATVEKLTVVPSGSAVATITIDKASLVKELTVQAATQIKGEGQITFLKVEADGVVSTIQPAKTEVKDNVKAPQLPTPVETKPNTTNPTNPTPQDPAINYIVVQSVSVRDEQGVETQVPASILQINKTDITVNLGNSQSQVPSAVKEAIITFGNLKEGDKITTTIDFPIFGQKTLTDTVEAGGKVSYQVADLRDQLNAKKAVIIKGLEFLGYDKQVEALLKEAGLSLEGDYLEDGSVDTAQAIVKVKKAVAYLEANKNNAELQAVVKKVKSLLSQFDVMLDENNLSVTGKVTVQSDKFTTEYTVTIKY